MRKSNKNMTPLMHQYQTIRAKYPGSVLFFRLGDFYEMFYDDAKVVSKLLNITLTQRHGIPMCGVPHHSSKGYIARLLRQGKTIAICEQTEAAGKGNGIVNRQVTEVVTPATVIDERYLEREQQNYLLAIGAHQQNLAIAALDISAGSLLVEQIDWRQRGSEVAQLLLRLAPKEIIIDEQLLSDPELSRLFNEQKMALRRYPSWSFSPQESFEQLCLYLKVKNLKGFGFGNNDNALLACAVIFDYLEANGKNNIPHLTAVRRLLSNELLHLDEGTIRNLELVRNLQDGGKEYTLFQLLNHCRTNMGSRLLRQRILFPLADKEKIDRRLNQIDYFHNDTTVRDQVDGCLAQTPDLERLVGRLALQKANPRDLSAIKIALENFFKIRQFLITEQKPPFESLDDEKLQQDCRFCYQLLNKAIHPEPMATLNEGRIIRNGYDKQLDELRDIRDNSDRLLQDYLAEERQTSGINSLKLRYNKIIGHFFEVSKSNIALVPDHFIRRQSLVGGERFTTTRLGELEEKLTGAREQAYELERQLFEQLLLQLLPRVEIMQQAARLLANIDCAANLAGCARRYGYNRPQITTDYRLEISNGRHPVVEAHLPTGDFIANSITLDHKQSSFALITGPNMAGKSTLLRQCALIQLLGQMGSYVPAAEAKIALADRLFCRIGSGDNLARGESTFLLEMSETANILRNCNQKSLVIMDEVGRGTSSTDGLAIAWAIVEYLISVKTPRVLFATHYHHLTAIKDRRIQNYSLKVLEIEDKVVFLNQLQPLPSANSYAFHVAGLAGLPELVIKRAQELRQKLTINDNNKIEQIFPLDSDNEFQQTDKKKTGTDIPASNLFSEEELIITDLLSCQLDSTTPIQALQLIDRWQKQLRKQHNRTER